MIKLTVLARMLFTAPVSGLMAFLLAAPWLVPVYFATLFAVAAAQIGAFDDVNAALASAATLWIESMGSSWRVPAWADPFGWLPVIAAGLVWLFFAQRTAMRLVGTGRRPPGPITLASCMGEWFVNAVVVPVTGITLLVGGVMIATVREFAFPFHASSAPALDQVMTAPITDFGRGLWEAYAGVPVAILVGVMLVMVMAGRFMALQSAFVEGSDIRGGNQRLPMLAAGLVAAVLYYPLALGVLWVATTMGAAFGIAGFQATVGQMLVLHAALVWCAMAAAAGFAAREEVEQSIVEQRETARRNEQTPLGVIAAEELGLDEEDGDELSRQLRAFEARQAA
ncbi:MAG: hypothetical protein AAFR52_16175 [Pseudomonadota bacterium]